MGNDPFMTPRLTGERFNDHAIPLEFLKDLSVIEDMIIEMAKHEYLKENPGRKRCPRGFTDGVTLAMTSLENGSAVAEINLKRKIDHKLFAEIPHFFEKARDSVMAGIAAAKNNESITEHIPEEILGYFDRLGRSLKSDETIEFNPSFQSLPISLTRETREKLLYASQRIRELSRNVELRGAIPEMDQSNMTFHIELADGRRIPAPMTEQHRSRILEVFSSYKTDSRKRLVILGVAKEDRQKKILKLESIDHIDMIDDLDVKYRIEELALLKDGWLDGEGAAPSLGNLDLISCQFERNYPDNLVLPHIYPTPEGGIQAEWSLPGTEASLEFNFEEKLAYWHETDIEECNSQSKEFAINNPELWRYVVERLERLEGVQG